MSKSVEVMEKIVALCRRRGFIFGSSEIYGGIGGFWDYGPLGCELKRNIKDAWWNDMVRNPPPGPGGREFQMVGVDCSIIMNPKVWEASGHATGFSDPMVDCSVCKKRFREDKIWVFTLFPQGAIRNRSEVAAGRATPDVDCELSKRITIAAEVELGAICNMAEHAIQAFGKTNNVAFLKQFRVGREGDCSRYPIYFAGHDFRKPEHGSGLDMTVEPDFECLMELQQSAAFTNGKRPCPACYNPDGLGEARQFNLMLKTHVGALEDSSSLAYLRPETAQGIFANFKNVMDSTRVKIPFGIAQMGKAFRNEINPRNYTFRSREFEQMEIEFFCRPEESMKWYEFWRDTRIAWYSSLGIKSEKLRPREQGEKELAHYSKACTDIEYMFPFSDEPQELEGVAHRGSFDLNQHGKFSKNDENAFAVVDDETKEKFVPHVIEPSAGVDRFTLAVICEAYSYDESRASPEFLKFHPRLAPVKAAVFPLVAKDGLPEIGEPIYNELRRHFPCQYDAKQSIGKRYARMDEAGTPFCFTIDGQTKEDGTVTVRNRDDASQERIDKSRCLQYLRDKLGL